MDYIKEKITADYFRMLYIKGECTREEAKKNILPYLDFINNKSKELCKKYNQKHKPITFSYYVR